MNTAQPIAWEDPPPSRQGRPPVTRVLGPIAEELKTRPGVWAKVKSGLAYSPATQQTALKKMGCEVTTRKLADGYAVFARWPS